MARTPKPIGLAAAPAAAPIVIDHAPQTSFTHPVQPAPQEYAAPAVQPQVTGKVVVLTMDDADKSLSTNSTSIATATKKINDIAKLSDMDELGTLVGNTLTAAKGYDPSQPGAKTGIFAWFGRKVETARQRYESVDTVVNRLVGEMDKKVTLFKTRVGDLQQIAVQNMAYHDSLTPQIAHLKEGVAYMEANPPEVDVNDPISAKKMQEWNTVIAWARKRADDLDRAQVVAKQQDAVIELMKQNSRAMAQRLVDLKETVLPIMQQTFALYVINKEQEAGAKLGDTVADAGDEALKKNAALLGQNTVAIHTSLNRSNFSVEAITANHDAVIQALNDIERLRAETKTRLANEAPVLEQKSRDLAARLAQRPTA